ncbi:MAG: DNA polymerase III subunit delta' C-terminal domain-containing protein, partial [Candidatus Roseilinea sp.]|uniref:DNA polymerase III subunit delta' C-terminal domain-containing protein n=1 Tax=Candidatus Roseilinea sp. TaxID=2838777 RepID=UPI0040499557
YWRDVARAASDPGSLSAGALINVDCAESIAEVARHVSPAGAVRAAQATLRAMAALEQNANPRLTFDALLLQLPFV